jgi:hypothetical protein
MGRHLKLVIYHPGIIFAGLREPQRFPYYPSPRYIPWAPKAPIIYFNFYLIAELEVIRFRGIKKEFIGARTRSVKILFYFFLIY